MVKACANAGVHYVDISDEFFWQREMADRYDAVARTKEVLLFLLKHRFPFSNRKFRNSPILWH